MLKIFFQNFKSRILVTFSESNAKTVRSHPPLRHVIFYRILQAVFFFQVSGADSELFFLGIVQAAFMLQYGIDFGVNARVINFNYHYSI